MIELVTSIVTLVSLIPGVNVYAISNSSQGAIKHGDKVVVSVDAGTQDGNGLVDNIVGGVALEAPLTANPLQVEGEVRSYFKDAPILAEIAGCESQFRQVDSNGDLIRGKVNKDDIGVMQINSFYHESRAKKLGFDLTTLAGNLAYAKWLYRREGVSPWLSSAECWEKYQNIARK